MMRRFGSIINHAHQARNLDTSSSICRDLVGFCGRLALIHPRFKVFTGLTFVFECTEHEGLDRDSKEDL